MAFIIESQKGRMPREGTFRPEDFIDSSFVRELDESGYIDRLYK